MPCSIFETKGSVQPQTAAPSVSSTYEPSPAAYVWASSEVPGARVCPCCHGGLPGLPGNAVHLRSCKSLSRGPGSAGMSRCASVVSASMTPVLLWTIAPRRSTLSEPLAGNMALPCRPDLRGRGPGQPSPHTLDLPHAPYFPFLPEHSLKRMRLKFFPGARWGFSPPVRSWWLSPHGTLLSGRRNPTHADLRPPTWSDAPSCLHRPVLQGGQGPWAAGNEPR